mgnify:CR=1 FL=1
MNNPTAIEVTLGCTMNMRTMMLSTILSLMIFHPILRHGNGFKMSQNITGIMMRIIGNTPVRSALKYSVVPVSLTIPNPIMKQSRERKTLAV